MITSITSMDLTNPVRYLNDFKRFYLNVLVKATCPECGKEVERRFDENYLSSPKMNTAIDVYFHHDEVFPDRRVHHEWPEKMFLRVSLEKCDDE